MKNFRDFKWWPNDTYVEFISQHENYDTGDYFIVRINNEKHKLWVRDLLHFTCANTDNGNVFDFYERLSDACESDDVNFGKGFVILSQANLNYHVQIVHSSSFYVKQGDSWVFGGQTAADDNGDYHMLFCHKSNPDEVICRFNHNLFK